MLLYFLGVTDCCLGFDKEVSKDLGFSGVQGFGV